jgi:hypothetical protein
LIHNTTTRGTIFRFLNSASGVARSFLEQAPFTHEERLRSDPATENG